MTRTLTILVAFLAITATAFSQTTNWTGTNSNVWNDPGNWDAGVPSGSSTVVIPGSASAFPSLFTTGPSCSDLTIESGASLTLSSGWDLSVAAGLTIDGTLTVTSTTSNIAAAGAWINNGTFTHGGATVTLDGTAGLSGASSTAFQNLAINSGTRTLSTAISVAGDCEIAAGAGMNVGNLTHTVTGNWTSSGLLATVSGTGTIEFNGSGQLTTLGNSLPNVLISAGTRSVNTSSIAGNLSMTGGALEVLDFSVVSVGGTANLSGGTLTFAGLFSGQDVLDVEGTTTLTSAAGTMNADSVIRVAGDWSSSNAWLPAAGTVEFNGIGASLIGGASPTFANLRLVSGGRTAGAVVVSDNLIIDSGATLTSTAAIDVNGSVSLASSSGWALGSSTHTVAGDWASAGGNATGAGTIDFDGVGLVITGSASIANALVSAGTRTALGSTIAGNLSLTGGTLVIDDDETLTVNGNAILTAGTLSWPATATGFFDSLVIAGDANITAAFGTASSFSRLIVGGNWTSTSAFTPTAGVISLDSGSGATIGGASPTFFNLGILNGAKTLTSAATVASNLTIVSGHSLILSGADMTVAGDVLVAGTLDLGSQTMGVTGNFTSSAGTATVSGPGTLEFVGSGTTATGSNTVPAVLVSGGTRTFATSSIAGNLDATGGTVLVDDNATLTVSGNATLGLGTTLGFQDTTGGFETLDVGGDAALSCTAGAMSANTVIDCAGNWLSDANWAPTTGRLRLKGGAANVSATDVPDLIIISGVKTLTAPTAVAGNITVAAGATLDTDAALDVAGNVTLDDATSAWDMGIDTHTVAGDFSSVGGSATGTGTLSFDGTGTVATGGGSISNAEVTAGTRTSGNVSITGNLGLSGTGTLLIADDATMTVGGDANLTAGTLSWFGSATGGFDALEVAGDVTLDATWGGGSSLSRFRVAGNWSSTSTFAPSAGTVLLDSGTAATIGGTGPAFFDLAISDGTKTITSATTVAGDLFVVGGQTLTLSGADASVAGNASILGSVNLGGQTLDVAGDWTSNTFGAVVTGPGTIEWSGAGTSLSGTNVLPDVLVSAGSRVFDTLTLGGNLDVTLGSVVIDNNTTVTVAGNATFGVGSSLGFNDTGAGFEIFDVAGAMDCSATAGATSANTIIDVAGDWTSDANWAPTAGRVRLDGGTVAAVAAANMPSMFVLSGTKTVTVPTAVAGDLNIANGAQLVTSASVAVAGGVSIGDGTAGWDIGSSTHTVAGDWASSGGSATGLGSVEFVGTGGLSTTSGSISNVDITAGTRTAANADIIGDLTLTGTGTLLIDDDTLVTVGGDANLTAGTLAWFGANSGGLDQLDVAGNAVVDATFGGGSSLARLRVAGNWTSSSAFTPTVGIVALDGASNTTIGGTDPTFFHLFIADGNKTVISNTAVGGDLDIDPGQTLTLSLADLSVAGNVTVDGTIDMGGQTASVAGDWANDTVGALVIGPGTVDLTSTGTLSTGANTISGVTISGGTRTVTTSTIDGPLTVTGGTLLVADNSTLVINGATSMDLGTTLGFDSTSPGFEVLDLQSDANIAATAGAMSINSIIECAGNWTSDPAWVPTDGRIRFDGGTVATIDGLDFPGVNIVDGVKTIVGAATITDNLLVLSGASLVSGAALDINGNVLLLDATASWDMSTFNHRVFGDWSSTGASATGSGTIEFDGTGTVDTGTGSIGNLLISDGTRTVANADIIGNLDMTGVSILFIGDDKALTVGGNMNLASGTLAWFGTGIGFFDVIDVEGDVNITAAFGGGSSFSRLRVGGNWSSSSAFTPTVGLVSLDTGTVATIGGASPTFFDLVIGSGSKTAVSDVAVNGDLSVAVGQAMTLSLADLSVAGSVTVIGALDLGGQTATVVGNWNSNAGGASVTGPGTLTFTGAGILNSGSNTVPDVAVTGGARSTVNCAIAGNLDVTGGSLSIQDNTTLSVSGDATLTTSTLIFVDTSAGFETLDVEGNVVLTASAGTTSPNSIIDCAGNWTSNLNWIPNSGRVRLDGGITTVSAAGFSTVTILSGTKTFTGPTAVSSNLVLIDGATLDTDAPLGIAGSVFLGDGTSSWDVGVFTHTVAADWISTGASAVGSGGITFSGTGMLDTGGGSISNATISSGVRTSQNATIAGDLALSGSGTLIIDDDMTLDVGGNADFTGGTLSWFGSATGFRDILDVAGDATVTSTFGGGSSLSRFRVGGNWSSTSAYSPTVGVVLLDEGTSTLVSGTSPAFHDLAISAGSKTLDAGATIGGDLIVSAGQTFTLSGADIDVTGDAMVDGTLDMGSRTATVDGSWTSDGVGALVTGPGTIILTGTGSLSSGANTVPDVVVSGGGRSVFDTTVDGTLSLVGGTLLVQDNATVTVSGDADFGTGAILAFNDTTPGLESLDIEGGVTMTATSGATSANTMITCAGSWSANGNWTPTNGIVRLDGLAITSVTGLAPDFKLSFEALEIVGGIREMTTDVTFDTNSLFVDTAAELRTQGNAGSVPGLGGPTPVTIDGVLDIGAGGGLALGNNVSMTVSGTGTLDMTGSFGSEASLSGFAGGGYSLSILGSLDASHFVFGGMDGNGVIVSPSATILDMDPGRFEDPSLAAGSTLLNMSRLTPVEFRYVDFLGSAAGTFNIATLFGSAIDFVNSSGDFAGETFDNDPSNLVTWTLDNTVLVDFSGSAGASTATLSWETSTEVDAASFLVERATSPGGPFTTVDVQPALGPGVYGVVDAGLSGGQSYTYRLHEVLTHGASNLLDSTSISIGGMTTPADLRVAGASGRAGLRQVAPAPGAAPPMPNASGGQLGAMSAMDLGDALAGIAGQRNPVIRVAPGSYAAFTVEPTFEGTLRILASGKGPVRIDTTAGPVRIAGLDASRSVELSDLIIGSQDSAFPGLVIDGNDGLVILDESIVTGGGGLPSIEVMASSRVALQRSSMTGLVSVTDFSSVMVGGGTVGLMHVTGDSLVRTAGVKTLSVVDAGSRFVDFGVVAHADVDVPEFVLVGKPFKVSLRGTPGSRFALIVSPELGWTDGWTAGDESQEMVAMLDESLGRGVLVQTFDESGRVEFTATVPVDGALVGRPIAVQLVTQDPETGVTRWSNAAAFVPLTESMDPVDVLETGDDTTPGPGLGGAVGR